ncbi:alpha-L-rhamnosidase C-terminal domain-containing protein [Flexithrix dorotheae]|uniref:alpha-L-rhamnosidase-related protein n=1 Tax=Flexithrix dorotheae TaxID=70993 RepID=UPI000368A72E|nr:alpha-L-rhamnosidase C-terminal domain-containing protein [Flexithrix dorotheae]
MKKIYFLSILYFSTLNIYAQKVDLTQVWPAQWITTNGPQKEYAVHYFRKAFELDAIPEQLIVHTSGDTRYQLFVNGEMVTWGPLTGDLRHWYYESTDIAPYLKEGKNIIAASVLNYGSHPPDSRLTVQTGFLLCADDKQYQFLNTNKDNWKGKHDSAYSPNLIDPSQVNGYYGGGSREIIEGNQLIWDWNQRGFEDSYWETAKIVERAYAKGCKWASRWKLTPRTLVHEELTSAKFQSLRIEENIKVEGKFPKEEGKVYVPPHTTARMVLDWGYEVTAYPVLEVSKGKNAVITCTYVEAPYIGDPKKKNKGNRNEVEGKTFFGYYDRFIADGGENRIFKPFWWRAFRYVELTIETKEEALIVNDYSGITSYYPFRQKASFSLKDKKGAVDNNQFQKMMEIGHRTIMACSHEHFMDCPYYEESQFEGDTRVQALVSYYNYGDSTLGKNAIEQFSWSINDEGFLSARYPTNSMYYIPNFSLYWIGMLYDYMMHFEDPELVASKLSVVRQILNYFQQKERENATLKPLDYHKFVDWSFKAGETPQDEDGYSALADLHYLMALQWATALEQYAGNPYFEKTYAETAEKLTKSIREKYWNEEIQLFTDVPNNASMLSQHTNCMAILTGISQGEEAKKIMDKVLQNEEMTQATLYWSFYVFEALEKAGLADEYPNNLQVWEEVMELGVTTWPETGPNSRSESHGWGASPNYHLLKIIGGISPLTPEFKKVQIKPSFAQGDEMKVTFPHPKGEIRIDLQKKNEKVTGTVSIPEKIEVVLQWQMRELKLSAGMNKIKF